MKLKFTFKDPSLFDKAITHPSFRRRKVNDFERLEFLGDRVLGIIVAEMLYKAFPLEKEGDLAKRQAVLISRDVCQEIAYEIELHEDIKVVGTGLDGNSAVLSDAMEALIGAMFLDQGLEVTRQHILPLWEKRLAITQAPPKDHKSLLQEWTQSRGLGIPAYELVNQTGPAHAPEFEILLKVDDHSVKARGKSRKLAEQEAAKQMLQIKHAMQ
ncbi:ribonuclease III [Candidatus Odyssella thessalonicensis]|nr:ribonuclease III [Candidatus Odyssella thessalonicensis]